MKNETPKPRAPLVSWRMAEDNYRVQCNCPEGTAVISKIPGAGRTAYSVAGDYLRCFDFQSNTNFIRRITEENGGVFLTDSLQGDFHLPGASQHHPKRPNSISAPMCVEAEQ